MHAPSAIFLNSWMIPLQMPRIFLDVALPSRSENFPMNSRCLGLPKLLASSPHFRENAGILLPFPFPVPQPNKLGQLQHSLPPRPPMSQRTLSFVASTQKVCVMYFVSCLLFLFSCGKANLLVFYSMKVRSGRPSTRGACLI